MSDHPSIRAVSDGQLRAWADAGVISSARFVDEMSRRSEERRQVIEPPTLDYELDIMLWPEELRLDDEYAEELPFEARPMFDAIETAVIAVLVIIAIALIGFGVWGGGLVP